MMRLRIMKLRMSNKQNLTNVSMQMNATEIGKKSCSWVWPIPNPDIGCDIFKKGGTKKKGKEEKEIGMI